MKRILSLAVLSLLLLAGNSYAQKTTQSLPPGTVDGRLHPELISDQTTWSTFIVFHSHIAETMPKLYELRRAKLADLGMPITDLVTLDNELSSFRVMHKPIRALLDNVNLNAADRSAQVTQHTELVMNCRRALESSLSAEGLKALRAYLETMKAGIKLYPVPAVSQ